MRWWDKSWNPITGCFPCSEGCKNCISLKNLQKQNRPQSPQVSSVSLKKELLPGINYCVCSLGDMFDFNDWSVTDGIFKKMIRTESSRFFITTKKTDQLFEYMRDAVWESRDMENLWFGCSIESQDYVHRIHELCDTVEIVHRFIQIEPMLGPVDLSKEFSKGAFKEYIEWLIVGCETGENARNCEIEWIRDIVRQAKENDIPVFVNFLNINGEITDDINLFPEDLRIRQIPWKTFFDFKERHDLLDGKVTLFKLNDGRIEINCPVDVFWKISRMTKRDLDPFGFIYKGKDVKDDVLKEGVNESIKLFLKIREQGDYLKMVSWDFLPKELICKFILNEDSFPCLETANDKELKELNKSIKLITRSKKCQ